MTTTSQNQTVALVLETHNIEGGGADSVRMRESLRRLFARLAEQTRRPDEIAVTHRGLAGIEDVLPAGARAVVVAPGATYYGAKNAGFRATRADLVVFADSDCWPAPRWLECLLAPFAEEGVGAVAGRTSYRDDLLGVAASAIDFLYFDDPVDERCTLNFYANNVAFERGLFEEHSFPDDAAMYRGQCQMLGARLHRAGVPIRFAREAHTVHRFPDRLRELVSLRLLRGRDLTLLAPHLAEAYLPRAGVLSSSTLLSHMVFAGRLVSSLGAVEADGARGLRRATTAGLVCAISLLDWAGSWGPGQLVYDRANEGGPVLSYHENRDRLASTLDAVRAI